MEGRRLQGAVLIALVLAALLFSCESNDAKKDTLVVYQAVHVYRTGTPPANYPGSDFITVIGPKDHVEVMQVVQKRDHYGSKNQACGRP